VGTSWERLAGREGGTVAALATATGPDGKTLVFAATSAGVYQSSDHGRTWTATSLNDIVPFNEVVAASPDFAHDRALFVGGRNGLYRSLDAGMHWARVLAGGHVMSLAVAPEVVLAGTEHDGVLRSEDGGRTWVSANPGLLDLTILALALSPEFAWDGTAFAATTSGVYRTRNAGKSWRQLDLHPDLAVQCLSLSPGYAHDRLALAGTESDGLLRSDDGGGHWEAVPGLDGRSVTALAFSKQYAANATMAAATDSGIAISRDGGRSWQTVAADLGSALSLIFVQCAGGEVLLAGLHRDGVARLPDEGGNWTLANDGLQARLLLALALSPQFEMDQTLFTVGPDDGVSMSVDAGRTWTAHLAGTDDAMVFSVTPSSAYARDRTLYAATANGIQRSRDAGASWQAASPGTELPAARALLSGPHLADGGSPLLAALTSGRLAQSDDEGESWRFLGAGFGAADIAAMAFSPDYGRDRTLFAATSNSGFGEQSEMTLWKSHDAGRSWARWLVEPGGDVPSVAVSPTYSVSGLVFVGVGQRVFAPVRDAWETRQGERRPIWRGVQVGRHGTLTTALATANRSVLFAATSAGVYVSRDSGEHFTSWNDGDGPTAVIALAVSPGYARDRLVYALGLGGTVWRRLDS
jgi:photosystem II stability/assembly factor-like uncharacterized protein